MRKPVLSFSRSWDVLGPFPIGTRECIWGADPLERLGGFRSLSSGPNEALDCPSSLTRHGLVAWRKVESSQGAIEKDFAFTRVEVGFPDVDWTFLQSIYGVAALQFQGWARGYLYAEEHESTDFILYALDVVEFWIDDNHYYGGDFYSLRRAPLVLKLAPGWHQIDVRLVRDVRVMGFVGEPKISFAFEVDKVNSMLLPNSFYKSDVLPDFVEGQPASGFASVALTNTTRDVTIVVDSMESLTANYKISLVSNDLFHLIPGQTRPLAYHLEPTSEGAARSFEAVIKYHSVGSKDEHSVVFSRRMRKAGLEDSQKITFLAAGGSVSYAVLRPPLSSTNRNIGKKFPILVALHGAGVEADSELVKHSFDRIDDLPAWLITPSGGSSWCGDDWHHWGWQDVKAAVAAIPGWIARQNVHLTADLERWLVAGHSNGGQGVWFAATHFPDLVRAAAPVSGYSSIQAYVPYQLWHETDPRLTAVVQSALNSYRHELLLENAAWTNIFQQHGGADDNVPVTHSRRMLSLRAEAAASSLRYQELDGKGHWFEGVMTTPQLIKFYERNLQPETSQMPNGHNKLVVSSPSDHGSKGGLQVTQLVDPGQLGRLDCLDSSEAHRHITSSNVRRFIISGQHCSDRREPCSFGSEFCTGLHVDGQVCLTSCAYNQRPLELLKQEDGTWKVLDKVGATAPGERYGRQLGNLNSILKSSHRFRIVNCSKESENVSLQISRNLMQYFSADSEITDPSLDLQMPRGDLITVGIAEALATQNGSEHPVSLGCQSVTIRDYDGRRRTYSNNDGLGAIFLRAAGEDALELVVWGVDEKSLRVAARLVPMLTGVGQPDFVVTTNACLWKGVDGVLAMGFFDSFWKVTRSSYLS